MIRDSRNAKSIRALYKSGWRVEKSFLVSPNGDTFEPSFTCDGYPYFLMRVLLHQLVAFQKFGEAAISQGVVVRHKDGNPRNGSPDNLQIGSHKDNMQDSMKMGRTCGGKLKFSKAQAEEVRKRYLSGMTTVELAPEYGCCPATIQRIVKGNYGPCPGPDLIRKSSPSGNIKSRLANNTNAGMRIREDFIAGMFLVELSKKYGCGRDAIRRILQGDYAHISSENLVLGHRFTHKQVTQIRGEYESGSSTRQLGKKYSCSYTTILKMARGRYPGSPDTDVSRIE